MTAWIFDRSGRARIIRDGDCLRSARGVVVAWISANGVFDVRGQHVGWFEGGVLYDANNCVIGFEQDATGSLPSSPGVGGTPGKPGFAGKPGRPGLSGAPGRPGKGGWSDEDLATYFKE